MKIAALYDIHGNLPALNAVLEELKAVQPDLIVVGGNMLPGPMPGPTLHRLAQLGDQVRAIRGNGDREVVQAFDRQPLSSTLPEEAREVLHWVAGQITCAERDFLAALPEQLVLPVEGLGSVLFCHATVRSDEDLFTSINPAKCLQIIFSGVQQEIVMCGHTHMQFAREIGSLRILNAGSVGMPNAAQPGAYWLLLSPAGYEFRRTGYDGAAADHAIRVSGYPHAEEFAEENVLTVPSAAEVTAFLERAAEKRWSQEG